MGVEPTGRALRPPTDLKPPRHRTGIPSTGEASPALKGDQVAECASVWQFPPPVAVTPVTPTGSKNSTDREVAAKSGGIPIARNGEPVRDVGSAASRSASTSGGTKRFRPIRTTRPARAILTSG